ncbi:unnamed protein product [Phytophthora lilii]|uniref:Unnamed protein product n=1 Tax=Phytophthora lilii TaxID=2077276 RepID=A0A9W6U1G6_9STRA|nr:unnamed protein product [Phytophthora lilii]
MVEELQLLDSSVNLKQLEPPVRGKAVGGAYITSDVDPFEDERDYKSIERPDMDAIHSRLKEMVTEAVDNGFPADTNDKLYKIVSKRDIWRLQIDDDPPARLPPFKIRLKEGEVFMTKTCDLRWVLQRDTFDGLHAHTPGVTIRAGTASLERTWFCSR